MMRYAGGPGVAIAADGDTSRADLVMPPACVPALVARRKPLWSYCGPGVRCASGASGMRAALPMMAPALPSVDGRL